MKNNNVMVIKVDEESVFKVKSFAQQHGCETCLLSTHSMSARGEEEDLAEIKAYAEELRHRR